MTLRGAYHQLHLGPEQNSTPVAGANDTAVGSNTRKYTFFTLPSVATFYIITGIEVLNGTVLNGNLHVGVEKVDASPPVDTFTTMVAWGSALQAGASAVQRIGPSRLSSHLVAGGTICGVFLLTNSATGRYGTTTVSSANNTKTVTAGSDQPTGSGGAWTATTEEPYIKVYYKAVL